MRVCVLVVVVVMFTRLVRVTGHAALDLLHDKISSRSPQWRQMK